MTPKTMKWCLIIALAAGCAPNQTIAQDQTDHGALNGLQSFARGNSAASGMVNFGLSLFGQNPEQAANAAAADGMQLLVRLWEQNRHNRQKAWVAFFQSPEGQRIMRVPGALTVLKRFPSDLNRWDSQAVKDGRVFVH